MACVLSWTVWCQENCLLKQYKILMLKILSKWLNKLCICIISLCLKNDSYWKCCNGHIATDFDNIHKTLNLEMIKQKVDYCKNIFMPPAWKVRQGQLVFGSSVCLSVCLSVRPFVRL